jgi:16S rRNA G1207 methylase RsmC
MSLSQFDFVITYCPSNLQEKSNALLQLSYLAPKEGNIILNQQKSIGLKPTNFQLKDLAMFSCEDAS